jgi:hypothetical protein
LSCVIFRLNLIFSAMVCAKPCDESP